MKRVVQKLLKHRWWIFRVVAVFMGLVLALALGEVTLRVLGANPSSLGKKQLLVREKPFARYYCYNSNPNGEFRKKPDIKKGKWSLYDYNIPPKRLAIEKLADTPWCTEEKVNKAGLRDREFARVPPAGVLRIAGIGDSFAQGEGVPLRLSLFKQIERELGQGYEVINGARPGVSTAAEVPLMFNLVRDFKCTRTIAVFIINDIELTQKLRERMATVNDLINVRERTPRTPPGIAVRVFNSIRLLSVTSAWIRHGRIRDATVKWYRDMYSKETNGENLMHLRGAFGSLAGAAPNNQTVLVIYPLMESLESEYPFTEIHKQIKDLASHTGMHVLDLLPIFQGHTTSELQVHPVDHHPNGKAHAIAAKAIVYALRNGVPGFLDRPAKLKKGPPGKSP